MDEGQLADCRDVPFAVERELVTRETDPTGNDIGEPTG
jgi:hypothetical protein